MRAMVLEAANQPLKLEKLPKPFPHTHQVLVKVHACGICRTDLHVVHGELTHPVLPLVPGHQIVGEIEAVGEEVHGFAVGDRIGVPWLGASCGHCRYCLSGRENLCDNAQYTGYQLPGGFAEWCVADARFCFPIPAGYTDIQAAPLLCAGIIGYRAYKMTGTGKRLGLYGFGSAAHILIQFARYDGKEVYVFTRHKDDASQIFAENLGAVWTGSSMEKPPVALDAAIIFAPAGELVPLALQAVCKGGVVVCAGIHMSDIPSFPYRDLWGERILRSVANLTREDGEAFLALASQVGIQTEVHPYPLERTNEALSDLEHGRFTGAAVVIP